MYSLYNTVDVEASRIGLHTYNGLKLYITSNKAPLINWYFKFLNLYTLKKYKVTYIRKLKKYYFK